LWKSRGINSKHEIRNPKQIQMNKNQNTKQYDSVIVSNFDIRFSDLSIYIGA